MVRRLGLEPRTKEFLVIDTKLVIGVVSSSTFVDLLECWHYCWQWGLLGGFSSESDHGSDFLSCGRDGNFLHQWA